MRTGIASLKWRIRHRIKQSPCHRKWKYGLPASAEQSSTGLRSINDACSCSNKGKSFGARHSVFEESMETVMLDRGWRSCSVQGTTSSTVYRTIIQHLPFAQLHPRSSRQGPFGLINFAYSGSFLPGTFENRPLPPRLCHSYHAVNKDSCRWS